MDWAIKNAKVGDKVMVGTYSNIHNHRCRIKTIERITPSGYLDIGEMRLVDPKTGNFRGDHGGWNITAIKLATSDDVRQVEESRFSRNVLSLLHNRISLDFGEARAINATLEELGLPHEDIEKYQLEGEDGR